MELSHPFSCSNHREVDNGGGEGTVPFPATGTVGWTLPAALGSAELRPAAIPTLGVP